MNRLEHPLFCPLPPFQGCLTILIGFVFVFWSHSDALRRQWDFPVYYLASQALAAGENPYDSSVLQTYADRQEGVGYGGLPYLYSPLLSRILHPLSRLPFLEAAFVWLLLKCIALELVILLTVFLVRAQPSLAWLTTLHLLAVYYTPIGMDINAGNVAIFESLLILLFLAGWSRQRQTAASLCLWTCSLLKGSPILLALYPLHLRDRRLIYSLAAVGTLVVVFLLLDWQVFRQWREFFQGEQWALLWDEQIQSYYNCSSTTVILRTFTETYLAQPIVPAPFLVPILVPLFPVAVFIMMGYAIHRYQQSNQFESLHPSIVSLLICGILLIPPRLAGYTLAWTFFPFVTCLTWSFYHKHLQAFVLSLIGLILLEVYLPPNHIYPGITQLLIDKEFFALLCLFLASFFLVLYESKNNKPAEIGPDEL